MGDPRSWPVLAVMSVLTMTTCATAAAVELVRDEKPVARIYAHPDVVHVGRPAEQPATRGDPWSVPAGEAVRELNYHLQKMSGASLEVIVTDDPSQVTAPAIVLGATAVQLGAVPARSVESGEAFRLLTRDGLVLIGGQTTAGTLAGTYELLRKLGCDWVMPGEIGEIIPQLSTVQVPDLDETQAPSFLFRKLWYHGYQDKLPEEDQRFYQWHRRHKGGSYHHPAMDTGSHAWESVLHEHRAMFDQDPTMLALRRAPDGTMKRMGPQLESTHPKLIQFFVDQIRQTYERNIGNGTWTKQTPAGFGIGPADGADFSMSAESIMASAGRIDPMAGELDRTDLLVLLGNQVLEQVHGGYPNAYVGFYSYSVHSDYPARYKPHPNLVITFAPISFSRYHGVLDDNSKTQAYYRDVVEQWGKLSREQGNPLIYRGYNWNLAENMIPYSKVRIWGEELPFYKQQGIIGLVVEATKSWSVLGPSDYVFMRLAWDMGLRWQDVLREYCVNAFGEPAAEPMEQYFLRLTDRQSSAGQEAGSYHAIHLIYDATWVGESQELLDDALARASTEPARTRVRYIAQSLHALRLYLQYHDATLRFDFPGAQSAYDAMLAHYEQTYASNSDLVSNYVPVYLKRFLADFVGQATKYSQSPYRIVHRLPDELPTLFDPLSVGERMQYQSPVINDAQFVPTKTITTTWDTQGLGAMRSGTVWYRYRFTLPADLKGQPIGLFLGGVDDEARVFLNGKGIGTSGPGFSLPLAFDLTDQLNPDGENLLAIQVVRNSGLNELGVGGILRPSFLFTGPQLPQRSPKPLKFRRLLPGGGVEVKQDDPSTNQ